jgi:hypothetical protein
MHQVHRNYDEEMRRGVGIRRNYGGSKVLAATCYEFLSL